MRIAHRPWGCSVVNDHQHGGAYSRQHSEMRKLSFDNDNQIFWLIEFELGFV
jgi:hypothetical protein